MLFLVSLFKWVILAFCFFLVIGIALVLFAVFDPSSGLFGLSPAIIPAVIGVTVFLILNLGVVAILVSIHDSHLEIAEGIVRIAEAAERNANS